MYKNYFHEANFLIRDAMSEEQEHKRNQVMNYFLSFTKHSSKPIFLAKFLGPLLSENVIQKHLL